MRKIGGHKLTCMDCKFSNYELPFYCNCTLKGLDMTDGGYLKAGHCPLYQSRWWTEIKTLFGYYKKEEPNGSSVRKKKVK